MGLTFIQIRYSASVHIAHLSADLAVVQVHQFVGMRAWALHLHGSIRELGAHDQTIVQVVGAAAPAISRLWDLGRDRTAWAQTQISRRACPCYGVADGCSGEGVDKGSLPRSCQNTTPNYKGTKRMIPVFYFFSWVCNNKAIKNIILSGNTLNTWYYIQWSEAIIRAAAIDYSVILFWINSLLYICQIIVKFGTVSLKQKVTSSTVWFPPTEAGLILTRLCASLCNYIAKCYLVVGFLCCCVCTSRVGANGFWTVTVTEFTAAPKKRGDVGGDNVYNHWTDWGQR